MDAREFSLPVCWKDDVRMRALFSEFRAKEANPEGWQDKMDFWVSLILQWSRETRTPVFSAFDMASVFERNRAQPACLHTVLAHMKRTGDLAAASEYFANDGWVKWGFDVLVKKPLNWMWGWGAGGEAPADFDEPLVNVDIIKQLQKEVLKRCEDEKFVEDVVAYSDVWKICQGICKDERSFAYVLSSLERSKHLRLVVKDGKKAIHFFHHRSMLTEQDRALLKLEKAKQDLNQKVEVLQQDIDRCTREALDAKKQGLQNKALYILKKRRRAQQVLDKQFAMLDNIHSLEMNLAEKKDIEAVYDGYRTAAQALKVAHGGIEAEDVDDVVSEIHGSIEEQQELSRLMGAATVSDDLESADLEEELNQILNDSAEGPQDVSPVSEGGLVFPTVPTHDPHSPPKATVAPRPLRPTTLLPAK
ncbi:unnamed protein product [Ixodes hexagonus]